MYSLEHIPVSSESALGARLREFAFFGVPLLGVLAVARWFKYSEAPVFIVFKTRRHDQLRAVKLELCKWLYGADRVGRCPPPCTAAFRQPLFAFVPVHLVAAQRLLGSTQQMFPVRFPRACPGAAG